MIDLSCKSFKRIDETTIGRIKNIKPDVLAAHGAIKRVHNKANEFVCPFCGNGEGDDATGIKPLIADNHVGYKCQRCDAKFDNISILSEYYKLNAQQDFNEICRRACDEFNISLYTETPAQAVKQKSNADEEKEHADRLKKINAVITDAQKNLPDFIQSQGGAWRGLTGRTLSHFGCGYLPDWHHSKKCSTSPRVIIPAETAQSSANYLARLTIPIDSISADERKWIQEKEHDGEKTLFNRDATIGAKSLVVVEGYIDAMSIFQAFEEKIKVVALGGKNGGGLLLNVLKTLNQKPETLILFDADATDTAENLRGELVKIGVPAVNRIFDDVMTDTDKQAVGGKIDANRILVALGADKLKSYTESILTAAQIDFKAVEEKIARDAALMKRLEDWQEREGKINPDTLGKIKTAFDALDALTPETFTVADVDKHKQNAALALTYGLRDAAEKYFKTIKAAKEIARNRIRESDSDLTKKLSDDELNALTALAEGVDIKTLRREVDREVTALDKAHKDFIKAENARIATEEHERELENRKIAIGNVKAGLKQLHAQPQSDERDKEIIANLYQLFSWRRDKNGRPVDIAVIQKNAELIFEYDPDIAGLFGFDEFAQADVFLKPAPWKKKAKKGDEWTDRDDANLRLLIRGRYTDFANKELIADNITKFSDERAFHEVKEYFHNLPKWDGKPRAETLFIDWLKVEDTPFAREVTMKILMAAVARIYHPGCTFQNAVIIHGNQKIGKGYILERLGGKWYKAITDHVDDPHAVDAIRICWIGEFKEMASMRKADVNAIKEFIELSADTRRFAYARRATTVPRHCVFFITVNDDQFLADMTGNRRFWILHSPLPKFGYVKEVRGERLSDDNVIAQIWAEVFAHCKELFKDGFDEKKLVLSTESEFKGEEIAEQYLRDDGLQGEIQAFLDDTKILPPVIWDLLSKEQRRQFFVDNGVFAIEEEELAAKFKASRKIIPPDLQAEFDAAIKPCDFVHRSYMRDKKTGEVTTYLKFIGNVYRQHICAAEIRAECFDKSDRRAAPQRINETLTRLEGWSLGKRIQKTPEYGDQRKVYYRTADNVPVDDEPPAVQVDTEPTTDAPPCTDTAFEEKICDEPDFDLSQFDE